MRQAAAGVLGQLSSEPGLGQEEHGLLLESLVGALCSSQREVRRAAAGVVARLGERGAEVLVQDLYKRHGANGATSYTLSETGANVVWALLDALQSSGDEAQCAALHAVLGRVGAPAVPALLQAVLDERREVRHAAVWPLKAIGPGAIPPLEEALQRGEPLEQAAAANILGRLGAPAVPALMHALRSGQPGLPELCVEALAHIGQPAIPYLLEAVLDEDRELQALASRVLGRIEKPGLLAERASGAGDNSHSPAAG